MSQLTIAPDVGKDFEWEEGATYDMRVTGTVTSMTPDGSYTLDVTSVEPEEAPPEDVLPEDDEESISDESEALPASKGPDKKRKSAVMMMIGKE